MSVRCWVRVAFAALACAGGPALAAAQDGAPGDAEPQPAKTAKDWDAEGRSAFEGGAYRDAASAFDQAFAQKPHPATRYNAALSWDRAGEPARAADAFEAALELEGLDPERTRASESRLSELKRSLASVTVRRPLGATLTIAQLSDVPIPVRFHLTPGTHRGTLRTRAGQPQPITISARAGEVQTLAFDAPAPPPQPIGPPSRPLAPRAAETSGAPWPWVALGGAAVFSGAAIVLGLEATAARDDFVDNHRDDPDARDKAVGLRTWTNVAWGAALVSGAVGAVLLLAEDGQERARGPRSTHAHRRPKAPRF